MGVVDVSIRSQSHSHVALVLVLVLVHCWCKTHSYHIARSACRLISILIAERCERTGSVCDVSHAVDDDKQQARKLFSSVSLLPSVIYYAPPLIGGGIKR